MGTSTTVRGSTISVRPCAWGRWEHAIARQRTVVGSPVCVGTMGSGRRTTTSRTRFARVRGDDGAGADFQRDAPPVRPCAWGRWASTFQQNRARSGSPVCAGTMVGKWALTGGCRRFARVRGDDGAQGRFEPELLKVRPCAWGRWSLLLCPLVASTPGSPVCVGTMDLERHGHRYARGFARVRGDDGAGTRAFPSVSPVRPCAWGRWEYQDGRPPVYAVRPCAWGRWGEKELDIKEVAVRQEGSAGLMAASASCYLSGHGPGCSPAPATIRATFRTASLGCPARLRSPLAPPAPNEIGRRSAVLKVRTAGD